MGFGQDPRGLEIVQTPRQRQEETTFHRFELNKLVFGECIEVILIKIDR